MDIDVDRALQPVEHMVEVELQGKRRIRAQQTLTQWRPWKGTLRRGPLELRVDWPAEVEVGREAKCLVSVRNDSMRAASLVTIELGLPPGCSVDCSAGFPSTVGLEQTQWGSSSCS
ncbi:MAG: hypothetical protein ACE5F1_13680, partial [Planctomycetota bacterium]